MSQSAVGSQDVRRTVVQVVDSLRLGGTERMAVDISNGLASRGWKVHLVLTREAGPLADDVAPEVVVHQLKRASRWDLRGLWTFRRLVRRVRPLVVHTHGWSTLQFTTAALLGGWSVPPVVHHDHGAARYRTRSRLYKLVAWPFVQAHLAVGATLLEPPLSTRHRAIAEVVVNGIPLDRIAPKDHYDWSGPARLVVVGNLREQKDHLGLLRALALLAEQGRPVRLDVIGAAPDLELERACREAASALGPEVVTFLGRCPDVGARLGTYDLGVISSATESGPIALIEYLAAGLPFVTTEVGEVVARLPAGLRPWVVPPSDPEMLAEGISRALDASAVDRRVTGNLERAVAEGLSIDHALDVVEDVYRRLAARAGSSPSSQ